MFSEAPEKLLRPMLIAGTLDLLQLLYPWSTIAYNVKSWHQ